MKIAFYTNFINHHQVHVADELYHTEGVYYTFVATEPMPDSFKKAGYPDYSTRPYLLNAYESEFKKQKALQLAFEADVVIIGSASDEYIIQRIQAGKLTFRYNERWFKSKPWYKSTPKEWLRYYIHHIRHKNKPLYMLAASAYTANDVYAIGAYKNKVFKWGYFPKVSCNQQISEQNSVSNSDVTTIMWCARFLDWKHPELPVLLARKLKNSGYKFSLDMYGSGEEWNKIQNLITKNEIVDFVHLRGNLPNDQILEQMKSHNIFLFTSDKNEGWGAVLNEAMSAGCAVVASDMIGSTPFLINDGENGLIFESKNIDSLYKKVSLLIDNTELRNKISKKAIYTMQEVWSPKNAAKQLLNLITAITNNDESLIAVSGPCSRAYPIK